MIVIISEEADVSTKRVIDWLISYRVSYVVINENNLIEDITITLSNNKVDYAIFFLGFKQIKLSDISKFWYRRGGLDISYSGLTNELSKSTKENHLRTEWEKIATFCHRLIEQKDGIGCFETANHPNKLHQLVSAIKAELNIPETLISNNKAAIVDFFGSYTSVITKNVERDLHVKSRKYCIWTSGTNKVSAQNILEYGENGSFPSLLQSTIIKKYELRIFYLNNNFWAMCIFHNADHPEVDYRNVANLRMTPFSLPEEMKMKLRNLMSDLKLNSGSIDMLVDKNGTYYFLEVNPVGQYDFVSQRCNYHLDREIAKYLSS